MKKSTIEQKHTIPPLFPSSKGLSFGSALFQLKYQLSGLGHLIGSIKKMLSM